MKIIAFFLLFALTFTAKAEFKNTIMIKINSKSKISKTDLETFNTYLEVGLTKLDYGIISKEIQEEALKEQKIQRKSDCYDEKCLVDTGRMLAARELLILDIKIREKDYFKYKL